MNKEKFAECKRKMNELKQQSQKIVKDTFMEGAKQLFDENPDLQSFGWKQYTPWFNDGDTCEFGVHIDEPDINEKSGYKLDTGEDYIPGPNGSYGKYVKNREPSIEYKLQPKVREFLSEFDEDDFKFMFDDHVKVQVNRDGSIEVNEYSHD